MYSAINDKECETTPEALYTEIVSVILTSGMKMDMVTPLQLYFEQTGGEYYEILRSYYYSVVTLQLHVYQFTNYVPVDWDDVRLTMDMLHRRSERVKTFTLKPDVSTNILMEKVARLYQYECQWSNGEYTFAEAHYIK
jgi:hypothetical protein